MLGVTPILSGESEEEYRSRVEALIVELNAKMILQVYLSRKNI